LIYCLVIFPILLNSKCYDLYINQKHNGYPAELKEFYISFTFLGQNNLHGTRSTMQMYVPRYRINIRKSAIKINGPRLWNTLPSSITFVNESIEFKRLLKRFFLDRYWLLDIICGCLTSKVFLCFFVVVFFLFLFFGIREVCRFSLIYI